MQNQEKIINLIIFLSKEIKNLYITKLLKLIYIIDETSVKRTGVQLTDLKYKVWKFGPVDVDLYNLLSFNFSVFDDRIRIINNKYGNIIKNLTEFNDDEFSDFEIKLIQEVVKNYGHLNSKQLVEILHKQGSLWEKIVNEKNLISFFENEENNTSPFDINFYDLVKNSPFKKEVYKSTKESLSFQNSY